MGSSLISYGPLGTPPDSSRCPNGIARCTKVHLEGSQMHKSASGGAQSASGGAQMAVLSAQGRCPRGGKYVGAALINPG